MKSYAAFIRKYPAWLHTACKSSIAAPHLERLSMFDLEPLEVRRLRYDMVHYYQILNNPTQRFFRNRDSIIIDININPTTLNPAEYF
jgi:hypothetical protein